MENVVYNFVLEEGSLAKFDIGWPLNKRRVGSCMEHVIRIKSTYSRSCSNKPVSKGGCTILKGTEWSVILMGESGQTSLEVVMNKTFSTNTTDYIIISTTEFKM